MIGDRIRVARRRPCLIWPPRSDISADMLPLLINDLSASVQAFLVRLLVVRTGSIYSLQMNPQDEYSV